MTGATGYIGRRLLPALLEAGHHVVALARTVERVKIPPHRKEQVTLLKGDLLAPPSLNQIPQDIDVAYYLVHSMKESFKDFASLEKESAENFLKALEKTSCQQIIYMSGLSNDEKLSRHMASRRRLESILKESKVPLTVLRAGIVIGSGSASFEIIRDLVEKLPIMVAPKWLNRRCQPIAIADLIDYLKSLPLNPQTYNRVFEVGGPDVLTYKEMLLEFAKSRGLKRFIITLPVLTPNLSSLWLAFVTSTNFSLARSLVESLKNDAVCVEHEIETIIPKKCLPYKEALARAFTKIKDNDVVSSWKDSWSYSRLNPELGHYIEIPDNGCFVDRQVAENIDKEAVISNIWSIGGDKGWYYMNWTWRLRGLFDKLVGGVGLRRGRTNKESIEIGDALDFWRVIYVDKEKGRLLLFAEMKLPGEAWLELKIVPGKEGYDFHQTATFRPRGVYGRLYWYLLYPFHFFIFRGMCRGIARG